MVSTNNAKIQTGNKAEKVLKIISLSLIGLALLLAFIGCFGNLFQYSNTEGGGGMPGSSSSISTAFTWLFKAMWDEVNALKGQPAYGVTLTMDIFILISYLVAVAGIVTILFIGLKNYFKNHDVNVDKASKYLFVSVTPLLALIMLMEGASGNGKLIGNESFTVTLDVSYGWGPILMIGSMFVALAATVLCKIKSGMSANEIVHLVISKVSTLLLILIVIFSFKSLVSFNTIISWGGAQLMSFDMSESILSIYKDVLEAGVSKAYAIVPLVSLLLTVVLLSVLFAVKKSTVKIVLLASVLALTIVAGALAREAIVRCYAGVEGMEVHFGSSGIACICMSAVALVLTCVNTKFAPKAPTKQVETTKA